jgi:hypothetical protein
MSDETISKKLASEEELETRANFDARMAVLAAIQVAARGHNSASVLELAHGYVMLLSKQPTKETPTVYERPPPTSIPGGGLKRGGL